MLKNILIIALLILPLNLLAADYLYPNSSNVSVSQIVNSSNITVSDTLSISKSIINNESVSISGLYFSELVPQGFELASYEVKINGSSISCNLDVAADEIISGYDRYCWIIDDPNGSIINLLNQGDSLSLTINLTNTQVGTYSLPLRTTAFSQATASYFGYGDSLSISISENIDVTPPAAINDLIAF